MGQRSPRVAPWDIKGGNHQPFNMTHRSLHFPYLFTLGHYRSTIHVDFGHNLAAEVDVQAYIILYIVYTKSHVGQRRVAWEPPIEHMCFKRWAPLCD